MRTATPRGPCALLALLACMSPVSAEEAWQKMRLPNDVTGRIENTVLLRDAGGSGSLLLQCDQKIVHAFVSFADDMHVFFNRGDKAEVLVKVADGPTVQRTGSLLAAKDGRAVVEIEKPDFVEALKDGEIRLLVHLHNGRYPIFLNSTDTASAVASIKSCG